MPISYSYTQKAIIENIVTIHETGRISQNSYGTVVNVAGDNGGLTYGKHQTTINSGNLYFMLKRYVEAPQASYAHLIAPYLERLKRKDPSLGVNAAFKSLLKTAGADPVMQAVQDRFFEEQYWEPAVRFCNAKGFTLPLTLAVVYDSIIHGSLYRIDKMLPPNLPERQWISAYCTTRRSWFVNHSNPLLRRCTYRMDTFIRLYDAGNFVLSPPVWAHGQRADAGVINNVPASPNPPQPTGSVTTEPVLSKGDRGEDVLRLQRMLVKAGWHNLAADSIFGPGTDTVVRELQRLYGLTVDGIVGGATWRILEQIS